MSQIATNDDCMFLFRGATLYEDFEYIPMRRLTRAEAQQALPDANVA